MTSVRTERQISWLFRDFKPKAESWKELTNSYFFQLFPIFPHHNNWNNDRAFRSTDDFSVFTGFYFGGGGGGGATTPTQFKKKHNKKPIVLLFYCLFKSAHRRI